MMGLLWTILWLLGIVTVIGGVSAFVYFGHELRRGIYGGHGKPKE